MIKFNQLIKECTFNGMTIIAYDRAKKRDIINIKFQKRKTGNSNKIYLGHTYFYILINKNNNNYLLYYNDKQIYYNHNIDNVLNYYLNKINKLK